MSNVSITIPFDVSDSDGLSSNLTEWASLEQADVPNSASEASISDVFAMIGYAKSGMTSLDYISENCSSVRTMGDSIFINLDFYVWVSDITLPYTLSVSNSSASIGPATKYTKPTSFNIIFEDDLSVDIGRLFAGNINAEMPFFASNGSIILPSPSISVVGSNVVLSEKATTVLRAEGSVDGYKHTMTIELVVPRVYDGERTSAKYSVTGLNASITVQWGDCSSDDADCLSSHRDTLVMEIPNCVDSLISSCVTDMDGDGDIDLDDLLLSGLPTTMTDFTDGESTGRQIVYYSTCSGKILKQFWKNDE